MKTKRSGSPAKSASKSNGSTAVSSVAKKRKTPRLSPVRRTAPQKSSPVSATQVPRNSEGATGLGNLAEVLGAEWNFVKALATLHDHKSRKAVVSHLRHTKDRVRKLEKGLTAMGRQVEGKVLAAMHGLMSEITTLERSVQAGAKKRS